MKLEDERQKALDFLAGKPDVILEGREPVPSDRIEPDVIVSQKVKTKQTEVMNPRLKTEAYLKTIGKL